MMGDEGMAAELSDYHSDDRDAREYQLKVIFFTLALYGCFAAFTLGALDLFWMAVLTSVLVTRWMIAFHELLHLRSAEQLDLFTRLILIPFAPLNIGNLSTALSMRNTIDIRPRRVIRTPFTF